jgi:NAD(P)-dependent dehydrogenase (short-subunit alcohol dehydrogenase family)
MKLAIITGASSGIGLATAELFIKHDYQVINISRRSTENNQIIDITCNLAHESKITDAINSLDSYLDKASQVCLIHNACRMGSDSANHCDIDNLKISLAVNILAPSLLNQAILPVLPRSSSVIYMGSTLSEKAVANAYSYVTSKHANIGMMRSTCQDLAGKGIHTACICPGFTDTDMLRSHIPDDTARMTIGSNNGFNRLIESNEIAELIWWAHNNPVINGSVLHANLGQTER